MNAKYWLRGMLTGRYFSSYTGRRVKSVHQSLKQPALYQSQSHQMDFSLQLIGQNISCYSIRPKRMKTAKSGAFIKFHEEVKGRQDDFTMSLAEWEHLESEVIAESPNFAPAFDYSIMKSLKDKPATSISFMNYIKSKRKPNMSTQLEFISNCAETHENYALQEWEVLTKSENFNKGFVSLHGLKLISSIAKTSKWKDGLELFEMINTDGASPQNHGIDAVVEVIKGTIKFKDFRMFYILTEKYKSQVKIKGQSVAAEVYRRWLENTIPADVMMELLKTSEMPLQEIQIRDFLKFCNTDWKTAAQAQLTRIHRHSCRCDVCKDILPRVQPFDKALFSKMGEAVLSNIVVKDNIYKSTDPAELERFRQFISSRAQPFDCIIDALNVVLQRYSWQIGETMLIEILKGLHKAGKRTLVIFKKTPKLAREVEKYASVFMTEHKSYDDVYILLAAMLSGPQCYVITNDDFGDHLCLIKDPVLRRHLELWREQRRVFHHLGRLTYPPFYSFSAHESEKAWHIPYQREVDFDRENRAHSYMQLSTKTFLCVMKQEYKPSAELEDLRQIKNSVREELGLMES